MKRMLAVLIAAMFAAAALNASAQGTAPAAPADKGSSMEKKDSKKSEKKKSKKSSKKKSSDDAAKKS
jgi:Ni/Co efflux regulator RcnB